VLIAPVFATLVSNKALFVAVKSKIELACGVVVPIPTCAKDIKFMQNASKVIFNVFIFFRLNVI
jgi:hypothetical protein